MGRKRLRVGSFPSHHACVQPPSPSHSGCPIPAWWGSELQRCCSGLLGLRVPLWHRCRQRGHTQLQGRSVHGQLCTALPLAPCTHCATSQGAKTPDFPVFPQVQRGCNEPHPAQGPSHRPTAGSCFLLQHCLPHGVLLRELCCNAGHGKRQHGMAHSPHGETPQPRDGGMDWPCQLSVSIQARQ